MIHNFNIPNEVIDEAIRLLEKDFDLVASSREISPQYLAGLFDGEGCVSSVLGSSGVASIAVSISQKFPEILARIAEKFPTKLRACSSGGGKYPYFQLDWGGRRSIPFLSYIRDFVIIKHTQVEVGLRLAELSTERGTRGGIMDVVPEKEKVERFLLHEELKRLKRCPLR